MRIEPDEEKIKYYIDKGYRVAITATVLADDITPTLALRRIYRNSRFAFLFESAERLKGRYSFLAAGNNLPYFYSDGFNAYFFNNGKKEFKATLSSLRILFNKKIFKPANMPGFTGGAVGYVSYDYVRKLENIGKKICDYSIFPEFFFIVVDSFIFFDHFHNTVSAVRVIDSGTRVKDVIDELKSMLSDIFRPIPYMEVITGDVEFSMPHDRKKFIESVKKAREYIIDGDIIQVVLSRKIDFETDLNPLEIYRHLRFLNPSPYMYFYKFDNRYIIGSSPEALVGLKDAVVTIRPIAGTRPRGRTYEEDLRLEYELKKNEKEIAEHVMLVDLARNDIGRVSDGVKVKEFMIVERYSHVMHIVSSVEGFIKNRFDAIDVFNASFPAGTVTGAPKIRAMQIIDEFENPRGPYAGGIGYFSYDGNMDFAILIRSIFLNSRNGFTQAGAGVVYDSIPEKEYLETEYKLKSQIEALRLAAKKSYIW